MPLSEAMKLAIPASFREDKAAQCLQMIAARMPPAPGRQITLAKQRDGALVWSAASVHPLQPLETAYQGIVRDAARLIGNPDQRHDIESAQLGRFFFFDSDDLRLLGIPRTGPYTDPRLPLLPVRLQEARSEIKLAARDLELSELPGADPVAARGLRGRLAVRLTRALQLTREVDNVFRTAAGLNPPPNLINSIPVLMKVTAEIAALHNAIAAMTTARDFRNISESLLAANKLLGTACEGLCCVQMFHTIDAFFLFRLLVRYRVEATTPISADARAGISGDLTKLLHTDRGWLTDFLRDCIVDMDDALRRLDPAGNIIFFLKGGRALNYMLGTPELGENDWDTQIVINPNLPAARWYELFRLTHNEVVLRLEKYKAEFFMLVHAKAEQFAASFVGGLAPILMDDDAPPAFEGDLPDDGEDDATPGLPFRTNCKAELIDVGLPRPDTIEAREQWAQLKPASAILRAPDRVPYPGYLYYINEYATMILEAFAGTSHSLRKTPKRVERLYRVLTAAQLADPNPITHEQGLIPPSLLPNSIHAIQQIGDGCVRSALIVMLRQFAQAYALAAEPDLATQFDAFFAGWCAAPAAHAVYPTEFGDAITALKQLDIREPLPQARWTPGYQALADAIGMCQAVSKTMENRVKAQAEFIASNRDAVMDLVRYVVANSFPKPKEELEVQLAIVRCLAAHLQSDYAKFPRPAEVDPFIRADFRLFCRNPNADPAVAIQLVAPIIRDYTQRTTVTHFTYQLSGDGRSIRLYWPNAVTIGGFTYTPLVFTLDVAPPAEGWPTLSYAWGCPTLSLRDLVQEYRRLAADIEEFGVRARLRSTAGAMTEVLTTYENPEPPSPTLTAMSAGTAHYLMISSEDRANGDAPSYPPAYYPPDAPSVAHQVTLTANRPLTRAEFSLGNAPLLMDRSLDLLVVNQGHGDFAEFSSSRWTADDIRTNIVDPLIASGVRANTIVLDFCLSASLIQPFVPLLQAGGSIIAGYYSISELVVTTDVWASLAVPLSQRNRVNMGTVLRARLGDCAARLTGLSHLETARNPAFCSDQQVAQWLLGHAGDQEAISIVRYLPSIVDALATPQTVQQRCLALVGAAGAQNMSLNDKAVLQPIIPNGFLLNPQAQLQTIAQNLRTRLVFILTNVAYGVQAPLVSIQNLPTFAATGPSLWTLVRENWAKILSTAPGLPKCPTPFVIYTGDTATLTLDIAFQAPPVVNPNPANPLGPPAANLMQVVEPSAVADVPAMSQMLTVQNFIRNWDYRADYMQP